MPKKIIPVNHRLKTLMSISVPLYVRELVEELAEQKAVSMSEIGRRAFERYAEKEMAGR
jgi:hypothetical protein